MQLIIRFFERLWRGLNRISPETRNLIIILLLGFVFYSQINQSTQRFIVNKFEQLAHSEKQAEKYTQDTAVEINRQVRLIADKDEDAFDVLLLSYHNNTQSLQGYKYLYLSCLTEAPRSLDTPLLKHQWNDLDYIYYADELTKIHNQSFVQIRSISEMGIYLPKLYHLVKASDANSVTFFTLEGQTCPIGMVVILYKECPKYTLDYPKVVLPSIQKLAILLDYERIKK